MICKGESAVMVCALEPRSVSELEGTLLDPNSTIELKDNFNSHDRRPQTASTRNSDSQTSILYQEQSVSILNSFKDVLILSNMASSTHGDHKASPSDFFQYSESIIERDDDESSLPENINSNQLIHRLSEPRKQFIKDMELNDNTPQAHAISISEKAKLGSEVGRAIAFKERELTIAASRDAKAKPWHEKSRIEAASIIARQRSREGFNVMNKKLFKSSEEQAESSTYYTKPMALLERIGRNKQSQDRSFIKKGNWSYGS